MSFIQYGVTPNKVPTNVIQTDTHVNLTLNNTIPAGGLDLRNGTTLLDFNAAPDNNIVAAGVLTETGDYTGGGRLTLRDATLSVAGKSGAASEQTFRVTDVQGSSSIIVGEGSGGSALLNLGTLNRPLNVNDARVF